MHNQWLPEEAGPGHLMVMKDQPSLPGPRVSQETEEKHETSFPIRTRLAMAFYSLIPSIIPELAANLA